MRNRLVGILVIAIAALMGFIIYSFNRALTDIVNTSCSHGPACPMWGTINFHTNISLGIMAFVILIGIYLMFFGKEEKIVTRIKLIKPKFNPKNITKEYYQKVRSNLSEDERIIFDKIIEAGGAIYQSDLVEKTGFSKAKVTRVLDKLEGKGLIERRRRGMGNVIILKRGEIQLYIQNKQ